MAHRFFVNRDKKMPEVIARANGEDFVYMVSKECQLRESKAGVVCAMTLTRAAEALVEDSYQFATDEQIEAHEETQAKEAERITQAELRRSGGLSALTDALSIGRSNRAAKSKASTKES